MSTVPNKHDRIVVLIDMDCFYCQVEEKLNPDLRGKPIAVVQYNAWKGGGIIAVNYPARNRGVTRHMRGDEATEHCPDINLVRVPNVREKADLSKYREAGKEVASVLQTFSPLLERASVDEAYLDITQNVNERLKDMDKGTFTVTPEMLANTYALGYETIGKFVQAVAHRMKDGAARIINDPSNNDVKLLIAATVVTEIRRAVKEQTTYECSAGIAHNKILGKLVCGINKPNKQTLLPITNVDHLYSTLSVKKIQGLGGKFGDTVCESLKITKMVELASFTLDDLQRRFDDKNGLWLYNIAHGIDLAPVTPKFTSKSIGCCKKFPGRNAIKGIATLQHWLSELADEMFDRIGQDEAENNRRPRQITVSFMQTINGTDVNSTRSVPLTLVDAPQMASDALDVIKRNTVTFFKADQASVLNDPILFLGITVGKFEELDKAGNTIMSMFSNKAKQNEQMAAVAAAGAGTDSSRGAETVVDDSAKVAAEKPEQSFFGGKRKTLSPVPAETSNSSIFLDDTLEDTPQASAVSSSADCVPEPETVLPETDNTKPRAQKSFSGVKPKVVDAENVSPLQVVEPPTSAKPQKSFFGVKPKPIVPKPEATTLNDTPPPELPTPQQSTSTSHQPLPDYKTSYAEYQTVHPVEPPAPAPIPTERCAQCNRKVPLHELQSHADAHFAFQLSQEQRLEFRQNQVKTVVRNTQQQPSAKKPKLNHSATQSNTKPKPSPPSLLHKFLIKADADENAPTVGGSLVKCDECERMIQPDRMLEHADYHTARRLQMELNGARLETSQRTTAIVSTAMPAKPGSVAAFFKRAT